MYNIMENVLITDGRNRIITFEVILNGNRGKMSFSSPKGILYSKAINLPDLVRVD